MKKITIEQVEKVSGGLDPATTFVITVSGGYAIGQVIDAILASQPDGSQISDVTAA